MSNIDTVHDRLKTARFAAGFASAKQFAEEHNIPYITYSQHEAGKRNFNHAVALKYCELLEIDIKWLLTGEGHPTGTDAVEDNKALHKLMQATPKPPAYSKENHKLNDIDTELLINIYEKIETSSQEIKISLNGKDILILALEIYSNLTHTDASKEERWNMVDIAIAALQSGLRSKERSA